MSTQSDHVKEEFYRFCVHGEAWPSHCSDCLGNIKDTNPNPEVWSDDYWKRSLHAVEEDLDPVDFGAIEIPRLMSACPHGVDAERVRVDCLRCYPPKHEGWVAAPVEPDSFITTKNISAVVEELLTR